jgi:hypothetical protein
MICPTCNIELASFNGSFCHCCGRYIEDSWHKTFQAILYKIGLLLSGENKKYFNKEKENKMIDFMKMPLRDQFIDLLNDCIPSMRQCVISEGMRLKICDKEGNIL